MENILIIRRKNQEKLKIASIEPYNHFYDVFLASEKIGKIY
jgi:hypothetical protein